MFFKKRRIRKQIKESQTLKAAEVAKVRARLNGTNWMKVLNHIEDHKSYYAGGGLFVDLPEGAFGLHLSGRIVEFGTGEVKKMTDAEHCKVFEVYKKYKGETGFYRTNLADFENGE
jgi:hypothetical protein